MCLDVTEPESVVGFERFLAGPAELLEEGNRLLGMSQEVVRQAEQLRRLELLSRCGGRCIASLLQVGDGLLVLSLLVQAKPAQVLEERTVGIVRLEAVKEGQRLVAPTGRQVVLDLLKNGRRRGRLAGRRVPVRRPRGFRSRSAELEAREAAKSSFPSWLCVYI